MDYKSLEKEIKTYTDFTKQREQTLYKLSQFLKNFSYYGNNFTSKSIKSLEELYIEFRKESHDTSIHKAYNNFYCDIKKFLDKISAIFSLIDKNFADNISEFLKKYQSSNSEILSKLNKLFSLINEEKIKLEKYKYNYFDASKIKMEQEKKLYHENTYKNEVNKINKLFESSENEYSKILNLLNDNNNTRLKFLYKLLKSIGPQIKNTFDINKSLSENYEKLDKIINLDRDTKLFLNGNNFLTENNKRFINEKFLNYEIFKKEKNLQQKNTGNKTYISNSTKSVYSFTKNKNIFNFEKGKKILELGKQTNEIEFNETNDKIINGIILDIFNNDEQILKDQNIFLDDYLKNGIKNIENFMNILVSHYKKNSFIKIKNFNNLFLLLNILVHVINYSLENKEIFNCCFMVIFIAEKTIFFNKDNIYNIQYLCKLLSKNNVFSKPEFWTVLISNKINIVANVKTREEIIKKENSNNEKQSITLFKKVMDIFNINNENEIENKKIENTILFEQMLDDNLPMCCVEVLEEYIQHFANFNFDHKKSTDLILEISEKYKFNDAFVTYFMAELTSNTSINKGTLDDNSIKILDYNNLYFNSEKKYKRIIEYKMRGIVYSLKYLNNNDFYNVLAINKNYNKTLVKIIYKNLLIKHRDMNIENHLNIWKILINFTEIKKQYSYTALISEINSQIKDPKVNDVIDLDTARTNFDKDKEINQLKIGNILKAIRLAIKKTHINFNYYQGMNYIAAFLIQITNNEEESFYLFLSILNSTEYGKLFKEDLERLKKYFYVFERLLKILLPELYFYLKDNNIDVSYFISSWFITLFTNTFQHIKDKNNPKILLRIIDLFFFSGWKSIIKIGISLLKNYESKLMTLTFEDLLQFLLGGILKSDFFQNDNYDKLMNISINVKIKGSLISDVENEYEIKKGLPKIGKKVMFDNNSSGMI